MSVTLYLCAATAVVMATTLFIAARRQAGKQQVSRKHLGVYSQRGLFYPLKYAAFYALLRLRQLRGGGGGGGSHDNGGGGTGGYGQKSRPSEADMERVQPLSRHPQAIDAAYFNGYSRTGWYLGAGIQRRHHRKAECVMVVRPPSDLLDGDVLEWPWGPATDVDAEGEEAGWSAGGLRYQMVEPMDQWRVTFSGQLRQRRGRQLRQVSFDFTWKAGTPCFDFDTDMDAGPTCAAIAREPWSGEFFRRLREAHQTHYEQFGKLTGEIRVQDVGQWQVELDSMRDRSYGLYRKWSDFHRYILQYFVLEDSTCIAFHLVCLPVLMTHLVTGFVITPDKRKLAATGSSLALWQLGESEPPPSTYRVELQVQGGLRYGLEVRAVDAPTYYCGWNWEAKLHCVLAQVDCAMPDGSRVAGRGMCEFEYRHSGGRTDGRVPVPLDH